MRLSAGAVESAFSYSAMPTGERVSKMNVLTTETEWYMQDGGDVVADYATSSGSLNWQLSSSYVNALGVDSKVARIDPSGSGFWFAGDALGSATQLLSDQQAVVNSYLTTAWGEDLKNERPLADRYGFTQRERNNESGLMDYRARSYDPRLGRFLQSDPSRKNRVVEHYLYAGNQPTRFVDPSGLDLTVPWSSHKSWQAFTDELSEGKEFDYSSLGGPWTENKIREELLYGRRLLYSGVPEGLLQRDKYPYYQK